jgi:hypothetical protein
MSAPVAPELFIEEKGELEMAATQSRLLPQIKQRTNYTVYETVIKGITMTVQKAIAPTVPVSPAVIGLLFTIIVQAGVGIWWASSMSKEVEFNKQEIQTLKSTVETQKVYIDTSREKQIKLEANVETLEKQQQQTNLLLQMKGVK